MTVVPCEHRGADDQRRSRVTLDDRVREEAVRRSALAKVLLPLPASGPDFLAYVLEKLDTIVRGVRRRLKAPLPSGVWVTSRKCALPSHATRPMLGSRAEGWRCAIRPWVTPRSK